MAQPPAAFVIARNPEPHTRLPYLLRLPVEGEGEVVLACRETWPGVKDAYCHTGGDWPADADVVETVPVVSCRREGQAIHLTLDRRQRRRSMFVYTRRGDRTYIFWRTPKTMSAARPGLKVPAARAADDALTVAVDIAERYAWTFPGLRASPIRRRLPVGDYGVLDAAGRLVAVVERKAAGEVATAAVGGTLAFALAELATAPRAVLIVEGRLSDVLKAPGAHVNRGWLLSSLAALQASHPTVPWIFADNRALAEDYGYRWLAAAARAAGASSSTAAAGAAALPASTATRSPQASERRPASAPPPAPAAVQRPLVLRDRGARIDEALTLAGTGRRWSSADYAAHFGVSVATALADLKALVDAGALRAEGAARRGRRYAAVTAGDAGRPGGGGDGGAAATTAMGAAASAADIIDLYERHAHAWDADRGRDLSVEVGWLGRFVAELPRGATVLDLGCGTGQPIARHLIDSGFAVVGVDASPAMIALCRQRLPGHDWIVGDMRALALGRTFGGIVAWDSFFHLAHADQQRMFAVFRDHAAPGGVLLFTSGPSHGVAMGTFHGDPLYHASLAPEAYRDLLDAHGFDVVAHRADDPDCGGHTVWLARARGAPDRSSRPV